MNWDSAGQGFRGANQRADWDREQARALAQLDGAMQRAAWDDKSVYWCRRWAEWYLRWLGPEDWRTTTPNHLARFLQRHHARGRPKWQLTQGLNSVLLCRKRGSPEN